MPFLKIVFAVLLACLLFTPLAMGTANAASEFPGSAATAHQIACDEGVCSLHLDLGDQAPPWLPATGVALSVLEKNLAFLPEGAGVSITDGLTLDLPIGRLKLSDAQIDVTMGADGRVESFYGKAQLPSPSLGTLFRSATERPVDTAVGFDYAGKLPQIDASLDPNRKYLFFDLAAGTNLEASLGENADSALWLTIPEGQRATVVVDPQERFAFLDGNVTIRYNGSVAFLTQLLDPTQTVDLLSGELPIRHQATVHVTGVVADEIAETRLELAGRYAVDGGAAAEWLNIDGEPLTLEGELVISEDGLLGTGIVRSSVLPAKVWDGAVQAQVFVPFSLDLRNAYVALDTHADVPFAELSADGYARVDGAIDVTANGSFEAPWQTGTMVASADSDAAPVSNGAADSTGADGYTAGRWSKAWDATAAGAQYGVAAAGRPVGAAAAWTKSAANAGYDAAAGGIGWTVDLAAGAWCSTTGLCRGDGVEENAVAAANR